MYFLLLFQVQYILEAVRQTSTIETLADRLRKEPEPLQAPPTAIMPLVRMNRTLRDSVILILRKALFSRAVSSRQTAVTGILLLLRTFKISTSNAVSQLSQSSGSFSQLAMDITQRGAGVSSHDVLCSELLGVLKRCFTLQAEVGSFKASPYC